MAGYRSNNPGGLRGHLLSLIAISASLSLLVFFLALAPAQARQSGKLSSRLDALATAGPEIKTLLAQPNALSLPAAGPGSLTWDARGRILAYVRLSSQGPLDLEQMLEAGAEVVHLAPKYGIATVLVAPENLKGLAAANTVSSVQEVLKPTSSAAAPGEIIPQGLWWCTGQFEAESAVLTRAKEARQTYGINGEGVRVGIISDSFGYLKTEPTAATDVLTGDLPGPANACGWDQPVIISRDNEGDDEGRAMAQIVHDFAPAASLYYATAYKGFFDFADQILALWEVDHCDVIVDDIGYNNAPFFQDGPVSSAVDTVTAGGVFYFTSAGNGNVTDSLGHNYSAYEAPAFRPMAFTFTVSNSADDSTTYETVHDFDPGPGTDPTMNFILKPGGKVGVSLQWGEPWYGVSTDLDLFILDENNQVLASCADENIGSIAMPWPYEQASYTNTGSTNKTVALVVARYSGNGTPALKYVGIGSNGVALAEYHSDNSTDTFGIAIWGHPAAKGAITVAAVPYNDINTPESFTSMGNPTLLFERVEGTTPAALLAAPETRIKPEITTPDGVANTFFGQLKDGVWRFYGTSASSPAAAGVGALMKSRAGQMGVHVSPTQAKSFLQLTAVPIANGSAVRTGSGLVDAVAALAAIQDNSGPTVWVERLYGYAYDRDPSAKETSAWVNQLLASTAWGETVGRSLFNSAEFIARGLNDEDFISVAYWGLTGTDLESYELEPLVAQLESGMTRAEMIDQIISLPLFDELCTRYKVEAYQG